MGHVFTDLFAWVEEATGNIWVPIIVTSAAILLCTFLLAKVVSWGLKKLLTKDSNPLPSMTIYVNIARIVIWLLGISILLAVCFGIDITGVIAALGVGGIAVSLGFKDTISNLISGVQLSSMKIMEPGEHIEVAGVSGTVKDTTWRHTTIHTMGDDDVIVPNAIINSHYVVQKKPFKNVRVHVVIPFEKFEVIKNETELLEGLKQKIEENFGQIKGDLSLSFSSFSSSGAKGTVSFVMAKSINGAKAAEIKSFVVKEIIAKC